MVTTKEGKHGPIQQRRDSGEDVYAREGGAKVREYAAGDREPSLEQNEVPGADRISGQTRTDRKPYAGEVIGGRTEPPFEVVGIDALSPILGDVDYPATREQIIAELGDVRIPVTRDRAKTVREILEDVTPTTFDHSRDVEAAVKRNWDAIAERQGRGGRQDQNDNTWRK